MDIVRNRYTPVQIGITTVLNALTDCGKKGKKNYMVQLQTLKKSYIQIKDLAPNITPKELDQLKKVWGVEKLIVMAAKNENWIYLTSNVNVIDQLEGARQLLECSQRDLDRME